MGKLITLDFDKKKSAFLVAKMQPVLLWTHGVLRCVEKKRKTTTTKSIITPSESTTIKENFKTENEMFNIKFQIPLNVFLVLLESKTNHWANVSRSIYLIAWRTFS